MNMISLGRQARGKYQNGYNDMNMIKIAYGIGQMFHARNENIKFDFVCDKKLGSETQEYEGIRVLSVDGLRKIDRRAEVIIFIKNIDDYLDVKKYLSSNAYLDVKHYLELFPQNIVISKLNYRDYCGDDRCLALENDNIVVIEGNFPDKLKICFWGRCNRVYIGKHIHINDLMVVNMGSNACTELGNNLRATSATITSSFGNVIIGDDCLLSSNVCIRNTNGHHIFDKSSKKRIDNPTDTIIEPNVWICENATLLPGGHIGSGTVVGANSVTSAVFGAHKIVAGNPAKVIRDNIVWSRDSEYYFNHDNYDMCISKDFLDYL